MTVLYISFGFLTNFNAIHICFAAKSITSGIHSVLSEKNGTKLGWLDSYARTPQGRKLTNTQSAPETGQETVTRPLSL